MAGSASALVITTATTLDGNVAFTAGGASGDVRPIPGSINLYDSEAICLAGVCDVVNQDWVVFDVNVTAGSINDLGVAVLFAGALGMGYFTVGNPLQDGTGAEDTYTGSLAVPTVPTYNFVANGGGAGLSGQSLPLFVAYANGSLPQANGVFGLGAIQFMITEYGSASIDSPIGNATTNHDIVPEPSTALLLGMGLVIFGARARRRG